MNRRNFLKAAGLAVGVSLIPRDIGARDSYDPTPEHGEVEEFWDRDITYEEPRRWWSLNPGQRHPDIFQEDIDRERMLLDENRQRQFARWVEARETHETTFTDWATRPRNGPYHQTSIMTGQSYTPVIWLYGQAHAAVL